MTKELGNKSSTGKEKVKQTIMMLPADTRKSDPRRKERSNMNSLACTVAEIAYLKLFLYSASLLVQWNKTTDIPNIYYRTGYHAVYLCFTKIFIQKLLNTNFCVCFQLKNRAGYNKNNALNLKSEGFRLESFAVRTLVIFLTF